MARRKTHLAVIEGPEEDEIEFVCDGNPISSGTENEDLLCGRCHRTLFLGFSREGLLDAITKDLGPTRTAADKRRYPLAVQCDCGAHNRVWPVFTD
jgi:hypothetical protein